jgi:chromosome segregation ATPase
MATKSLPDYLQEIADAEERCRKLVTEMRELIQAAKDWKRELGEAEARMEGVVEEWAKETVKIATENVRPYAQETVHKVVGEVVNRELRQMVKEIGAVQHNLYEQVQDAFDRMTAVMMGIEKDSDENLFELIKRLKKKRQQGIIGQRDEGGRRDDGRT